MFLELSVELTLQLDFLLCLRKLNFERVVLNLNLGQLLIGLVPFSFECLYQLQISVVDLNRLLILLHLEFKIVTNGLMLSDEVLQLLLSVSQSLLNSLGVLNLGLQSGLKVLALLTIVSFRLVRTV